MEDIQQRITLDGSGAIATLNKLEASSKKVAENMGTMERAALKNKDAVDKMGASVKNAETGTNALGKAFGGTRTFGKEFLGTLGDISSKALRIGTLVGGVLGGIGISKTIGELKTFSQSFMLLNANLQAQSEKTKEYIKNNILTISGNIGIAADDYTKGLTEIFSAGITPKAAEGTAAYNDELERIMGTTGRIGQFAKATGENTQEMTRAFVYYATATNKSLSSTKDVNDIVNILGATLKHGVGTMSEYSAQFAKFSRSAQQAGFSETEAVSMFAALTKTGLVAQAGNTVGIFARMMNDAVGTVQQGGKALETAMQSDVYDKLSGSDQKIIGALGKKGALTDFFMDKQGMSKGLTETVRLMKETYDKLEKDPTGRSTAGQQMFMKAFSNNEGERKALRELLNSDNYSSTLSAIDKDIKGGAGDKMIESMTGNFFDSRTRMTTKITNETIRGANIMTPALGVLAKSMWSLLSGGTGPSSDSVKKALDSTRNAMEEYMPALKPVVDQMEKFILYLQSDAGRTFFNTLARSMKDTATAIFSIIGAFGKIASNPAVQALISTIAAHPYLAVAGYAALKTSTGMGGGIGTGVASMASTVVGGINTVGGSVGGTIGKSIGGAMVGVLGSAGPAAGAKLGASIGSSLVKLTIRASVAYTIGEIISNVIDANVEATAVASKKLLDDNQTKIKELIGLMGPKDPTSRTAAGIALASEINKPVPIQGGLSILATRALANLSGTPSNKLSELREKVSADMSLGNLRKLFPGKEQEALDIIQKQQVNAALSNRIKDIFSSGHEAAGEANILNIGKTTQLMGLENRFRIQNNAPFPSATAMNTMKSKKDRDAELAKKMDELLGVTGVGRKGMFDIMGKSVNATQAVEQAVREQKIIQMQTIDKASRSPGGAMTPYAPAAVKFI